MEDSIPDPRAIFASLCKSLIPIPLAEHLDLPTEFAVFPLGLRYLVRQFLSHHRRAVDFRYVLENVESLPGADCLLIHSACFDYDRSRHFYHQCRSSDLWMPKSKFEGTVPSVIFVRLRDQRSSIQRLEFFDSLTWHFCPAFLPAL